MMPFADVAAAVAAAADFARGRSDENPMNAT
jgi:hypothetical protein